MGKLLQQIVDGLASGSIYASTALALVFVFRSTHIVNFAQGEMAMFSTYLAWSLTSSGFPIWASIGAALAVSFVAGALVERVVVRHFERGSVLTVVIVTLGLALMINSLAGLRWGFLIKTFPSEFPDKFFNLGGVRFSVQAVGVTAVLVGVVVVLWLLFQHTKLGLALRAVAGGQETCRLAGVRVGRMLMLGWGMAAALGALAGALIAPKVFLGVLLVRPQGLFGRPEVARV
jgi:branched-chain amino acid transport system permease protein